jgi:tetratricopeptide (TPR) repeat protein
MDHTEPAPAPAEANGWRARPGSVTPAGLHLRSPPQAASGDGEKAVPPGTGPAISKPDEVIPTPPRSLPDLVEDGGPGKKKDSGWVGKSRRLPAAPHTGPPPKTDGGSGFLLLPPLRALDGNARSPRKGTGSALSVPGPDTVPAPRAEPTAEGEAQDVDRAVLLGAARTAVKRGDFDQAVNRYEEYFRRFGHDPALRREYAGVLVSANRIRNAAELYQQLLGQQPNNVELLVILGDLFVLVKEYRQAIEEYGRALELAPANLDIAAKLARAYAFHDDMVHALQVYDRYLAGLQPGKNDVPRTFGALLVDFHKAQAALPFLRGLLERFPDDLEILSDLVRCYSALEDRKKAVETLDKMASIAPQQHSIRQALGDSLYQAEDFDLAEHVYQQILQSHPDNGLALVGTARVALQRFRPAQAAQILIHLKPDMGTQRIYWLTWAEYHQLIGEYIQAKQIYANFLRKDVRDHEVHVALAALYDYIREFEKAKAEYSKVPLDAQLSRKARLGFASVLYDQRFFPAALEACHVLLTEKPDDGPAMALYARSLAKMGQVDRAVALCGSFLQNNPRNEAASLTVQFALARIYLDVNRFLDAAREYELLLMRPSGRRIVSYYGLARAEGRIGAPDKAALAVANLASLIDGDDRARLLLADLHAADKEDARVIELTQLTLAGDPHNLAALIRLADAEQRQAIVSGRIDAVVAACKAILEISPVNVRARLALARAFSIAQKYQAAAAEYERLIALDTAFTIPQRERARALFSGNQFGASAAAYQQMQTPSACDKLRTELDAYSQREPRVHEPLQVLVRAGLPGDALKAEVLRLVAITPVPEIQAALHGMVADYQAGAIEQLGAHAEGEDKSHNGYRPKESIPIDQGLVALEPTNVEGRFDLAQSYATLKQTHNELKEYADLLEVNPQHRESQVAQERAGLELNPQLDMRSLLFSQNGRNGLALIDAAAFPVSVKVPCGDENEYFGFAFSRVIYSPHDDRPLDGNIISFLFSEKFGDPYFLTSGIVNYEEYPDRFHSRPTFDVGAGYYFSDCFQARARVFLNNVVQNGETLRQDIFRTGGGLSANFNATRFWQFGGYSSLFYYSDVNTANETYLYSNYLLTMQPNQLKLVFDADMLSYAHSNGPFTPGDLHGMIHPYFAPNFFIFYEARLEWTQWLSRDYFVHSNQCYYSLQYGLGFDNHLEPYNSFRALFNFDIRPWLSVGADAVQMLSPVYKMSAVNAYLTIRFPWRLCSW